METGPQFEDLLKDRIGVKLDPGIGSLAPKIRYSRSQNEQDYQCHSHSILFHSISFHAKNYSFPALV